MAVLKHLMKLRFKNKALSLKNCFLLNWISAFRHTTETDGSDKMGSNDFITETCDVLNDDVRIVTQIPETSKYKAIYTIAILMHVCNSYRYSCMS